MPAGNVCQYDAWGRNSLSIKRATASIWPRTKEMSVTGCVARYGTMDTKHVISATQALSLYHQEVVTGSHTS